MKADRNESPFACNLNVLSAQERQLVLSLLTELKKKIQEIRELPDGYELLFPVSGNMIRSIGEFISYEKFCCPFFDFDFQVEREGPARLRLTGGEGVKDFIRFEFGLSI